MRAIDFRKARWLNEPAQQEVTGDHVTMVTEPTTDLWQRSYYGFRNDNAPMLLLEVDENFTFTTHVSFDYQGLFDQCGLVIYESSDFWFKVSVEYDKAYSRLGSVVTNHGYSDWATTDISTPAEIWYRLSRRGPDFLVEQSADGREFHQMRVFHIHTLGETTREMGTLNPPAPAEEPVHFGLYACSPVDSSFRVVFDQFAYGPCLWRAHEA